SKLRIRLVGDGPLKLDLIKLAADAGLTHVRFDDPVPKNEIPRLAAQADAFVICVNDLPALYKYGISMNKLYDYMAAGRPTIIATGSINNPIAEGGAGLTVPPGDAHALAEGIAKLMEMPPQIRQAMGDAGRRHVEDRYDYRKLAS